MAESMRQPDWVEVREAMRRIVAAVSPLPLERVRTLDALGRVLGEAIDSPIDQPPWDNSAMDGYAVRAADVRGASRQQPVRLEVVDDVPAGRFASRPLAAGQAIRINTGAPIPDGADGVIRVEHTDAGRDVVVVYDDADAGRNLRARGEDLRVGDRVLAAGRLLRPADLGLLATVGRAEVEVHRAPVVAILSNGDELVDVDEFDEVLAGRRIVNSNSYALAGAVLATGAVPLLLGIARDDDASLREHLEHARGADVLLTTAGASVGEHDRIKDVLEEMGFALEFWRVKMQPGSPASFGWLGQTAVFGLPGNPVSALVTFEVLVRPALRRMSGRADVFPAAQRVRSAERIPGRAGLTRFLRATIHAGADGPAARLTGPQGSGILTSVSRADALLVMPEEYEGADAGAELRAIPLYPADGTSDSIDF